MDFSSVSEEVSEQEKEQNKIPKNVTFKFFEFIKLVRSFYVTDLLSDEIIKCRFVDIFMKSLNQYLVLLQPYNYNYYYLI